MRRWLLCLVALGLLGWLTWLTHERATPPPPVADSAPQPPALLESQAPAFLTFAELKQLTDTPYPTGALRQKYEALWTTPIISNEASLAGTRPRQPTSPELGPLLRVVSWNIEQSRQIAAAIEAFSDAEAFAQRIDPKKAAAGSRRHQRIMTERALLEAADVIILQEMDIGVKRSGYRDAARDFAQALQMNYAYLPEYVEVDPVLLGTETIPFEEGTADVEATAHYAVDPTRYKGLFGCAVLSRYPILSVVGFRLFTQGYDWYWQEKQKTSFLEKLRRFGAMTVFLERQHREIKVGGRTYFRVDLAVPELPEQRVSIINVHLEIKCTPEVRAAQMAEILHYIKDIPHPVILAGDFNSAPQDLSPTSTPRVVQRSLSSPEFWLSSALEYLLPQALLINTARFLSNVTKNYQNPTAPHVPLMAPNYAGELFRLLERFRFADGEAFDFRGDRRRSAGDVGRLSNSNERDFWAYRTTFRVERTLAHLVGKYRLDWIFVKAYLKHPTDRRGSYRFAPHFGRTLNALNAYLTERISDHDPNVVDLPLNEPSF